MCFLPFPNRLAFLFAVAIAIVCGSKSVQAGVITESSFGAGAWVASAELPAEVPEGHILNDGGQSGMQGVPVSSTGASPSVAIASNPIQLADASITGRMRIVDLLLPDDPFLAGLPKPA